MEFESLNDEVEYLKSLHEKGELLGTFTWISNDAYHMCPGFSKSSLDNINKSWAHYKTKNKPTKAMEFGQAFHDMILLPHEFEQKNTCVSYKPHMEIPKFGRKKADQEEKQNFLETEYNPWVQSILDPWLEKNGDKKQWSEDDWALLGGMANAIHANETLQYFLQIGTPEVSFFWVDEKTGLLCKSKADLVVEEHNILVDLKSTADASYNYTRKTIANYKYDKQAAFHLEGARKATGKPFNSFVFACCEKAEPFGIALYNLDESAIEVGTELWHKDIQKTKNILEGKEPKTYPVEIQNINLPAWAYDIESR